MRVVKSKESWGEKGKERKGKERKGKERKGRERKEKEDKWRRLKDKKNTKYTYK